MDVDIKYISWDALSCIKTAIKEAIKEQREEDNIANKESLTHKNIVNPDDIIGIIEIHAKCMREAIYRLPKCIEMSFALKNIDDSVSWCINIHNAHKSVVK